MPSRQAAPLVRPGARACLGTGPLRASLEQFAQELAGYETSKGTIKFDPKKGLPMSLVRKIVKARIAENAARKKRNAGAP